MLVRPGTRLGPYDVVAPLGAGGMGEVYRARDTRLGRDVAIKVLPADVATDADRRSRFEREARAVAALSHPNILALFDIGTEGDTVYVVTELLTGETLADRLRGGALPVRKAVEIAIAIARGLGAAHEKGIAHRDLKPANVFLLADGQVKVLDFGLARETGNATPGETTTQSALTDPGTVLGTVGYMAPEQVRGQHADRRADLFALGVVLYEMLTGTRAFARESTVETLNAILKDDPPDLAAARADLPPALERIVAHALEKSAARRFQSAQDVVFALESLADSRASRPQGVPGRTRPALGRAVALAGAAAAMFAIGVTADRWWMGAPDVVPPALPSFRQLTFGRGVINAARFTGDGQSVVYGAALDGGPPDVYVTSVSGSESRALGYRAYLAAVSPKGQLALLLDPRIQQGWTAVLGTLARAAITGAAPRPVAEAGMRADFAPDGETLAVVRQESDEWVLEYPLGTPVHRSRLYIGDLAISPDGHRLAFVLFANSDAELLVVERGAAAPRRVITVPEAEGLTWSADGREVMFSAAASEARDSQIYAVTLDGRKRQLLSVPGGAELKDVAPDGRLLIDRWSATQHSEGATRENPTVRDFSWADYTRASDVSADGAIFVFTEYRAAGGRFGTTYLRKTDGSPPIALGAGRFGMLSPDGTQVAVLRGETDIAILPAGVGQERVLGLAFEQVQGVCWTPDGRALIVSALRPGEPRRLYRYDLANRQVAAISPEGVGMANAFVGQLRVSPDGTRVAAIDGSGRVVVVTLADGQVSVVPGADPGHLPLGWTADSRAVYVYTPQVVPSPVFQIDIASGRRTLWRELAPRDRTGVFGIFNVVVAPDGRSWFQAFQRVRSELFVVEGVK